LRRENFPKLTTVRSPSKTQNKPLPPEKIILRKQNSNWREIERVVK